MSLVLDSTLSLTMAGSHSERHAHELMFPLALYEHIELHLSVFMQFCIDKGLVVTVLANTKATRLVSSPI